MSTNLRAPYRSHTEIMIAFLDYCRQEQKPSWVMNHLRESWKVMMDYRNEAVKKGWLSVGETGALSISAKGLMVLESLKEAKRIESSALQK